MPPLAYSSGRNQYAPKTTPAISTIRRCRSRGYAHDHMPAPSTKQHLGRRDARNSKKSLVVAVCTEERGAQVMDGFGEQDGESDHACAWRGSTSNITSVCNPSCSPQPPSYPRPRRRPLHFAFVHKAFSLTVLRHDADRTDDAPCSTGQGGLT